MRTATYTPEYGMLPRAEARRTAAAATGTRAAKNIALALAAPLVTIAFVVVAPIAGLAMLAWIGARAALVNRARLARFARDVLLFAAAPFVALAYALCFPFVGLGMLAWVAFRRAPVAA
jgi:hypothetical protein